MKHLSPEELSTDLAHVYEHLSSYSTKFTILDLQILNYIGRSFDKNQQCGVKELSADLNITMSTISKTLKRWSGKEGFIIKSISKKDKRRHYYTPNSLWLNERIKMLSKIKNNT